tara:strand:- start:54 stop:2060 length:2007 start_codon:yes stop_codon:yes gene_type:complete
MKNKILERAENGLAYKYMYLFFIALLGVVIFLSYLAYTNFNELVQKQEIRKQSHLTADLLRQSSDDLTRLCRTYVITGDEKYEKIYWNILDVRNGKKAIPENYNRVYWDLLTGNESEFHRDENVQSLVAMMAELGFTKEEFIKLKEAKELSDKLVRTEVLAMNAIKGIYKDESGNYVIKDKPNKEMATRLMFGSKYHTDKAAIMKPIDEFFEMIDSRTQKDVEKNALRGKIILGLIIIFIIITMLVLFYILIILIKKIIVNKALVEKYNKRLRIDNALLQESKAELVNATQVAELANKAKSDFLANMSHEIRTPMNGILGFIDILSHIETDEEKREYLDIIQSSSNNLLNIINDILHISKIESGNYSTTEDVVDIYSVVKKVSRLYEQQAKAKEVEFIFEFKIKLKKYLMISEISLLHILNNLLSNALKFTNDGSVKLSLTELEGNKMEIIIEDTGIGISQSKQEKLYDAFDQGEHFLTKKYGGTGLGLPIVKKLIDLMGGNICFMSSAEKGTKVTVVLPFKDALVVENAQDVLMENTVIIEKLRIISAEDVEINQKILENTLRGQYLKFKKVYNGRELISELEKEDYDIILMDIQMPELNGIDATKQIRNSSKLKSIVIIGVSAFALNGDSKKAIDAGMDDYLSKPYNKNDLINIINKWGAAIFAKN